MSIGRTDRLSEMSAIFQAILAIHRNVGKYRPILARIVTRGKRAGHRCKVAMYDKFLGNKFNAW